MSTGTFLAPADAARELGISTDSVLRAVHRGDLRAVKYGRLVRIARDDFDAFLARHSQAQPAPRRRRSTSH